MSELTPYCPTCGALPGHQRLNTSAVVPEPQAYCCETCRAEGWKCPAPCARPCCAAQWTEDCDCGHPRFQHGDTTGDTGCRSCKCWSWRPNPANPLDDLCCNGEGCPRCDEWCSECGHGEGDHMSDCPTLEHTSADRIGGEQR